MVLLLIDCGQTGNKADPPEPSTTSGDLSLEFNSVRLVLDYPRRWWRCILCSPFHPAAFV